MTDKSTSGPQSGPQSGPNPDNAQSVPEAGKRRIRPSLLIAVLLGVGATAWILSGSFEGQPTPATANAPTASAEARPAPSPASVPDDKAVGVRVYDSVAEPRRAALKVTGRTQADRRAVMSAETTGRIVDAPVALGDEVTAGQTLVTLATDDRMARLREAQALLKQREIEFNAADKLSKKGFQSETNRAQSRAQLEAAQAQLERVQVELSKLTVAAPFDGIIEAKNIEIGDFAQVGTPLIHLVDLDPMLVVVQVSEREIERIEQGSLAQVELLSGTMLEATVRHIAPTATDSTRTFEVEVELPNPEGRLRDGVTASVILPTRETLAHRLSPAVLTLNDEGRIGVKAVTADDKVAFHPVDILEDRADGMWVTGLPMTLTIISVGQEYVGEGATVRPLQDNAFKGASEPKIDSDTSPTPMDTPPRVSQGDDDTTEASSEAERTPSSEAERTQ
jgi:multidrug efflux system membrane fusion protein